MSLSLPLASKIHEAVGRALERSQKDIEVDTTLESIHFDISIGRRSGMPVKVRMGTTRSVAEVDIVEMKK